MTDFLTLTEFVPGTKAKAEEVNANFSALKNAVNERALMNGNTSNVFNVAEGTEDSNAVTKKQLDAVEEKTIDAVKFCCNKGLTTDGIPSLLSYYNNTVTLNASTTNAIITDHLGVSTTITTDKTLDVSGITNTMYIYYKTDDDTMFKTTNKHVFAYSRPTNGVEDTIYIYPNNNVWVLELYKNSTWATLSGCTYLGSFMPGTELLSSANWTISGWSGDFTKSFTHATGNSTALSNTISALNETKYQITYTVTGRTAGSFTVSFGGKTSPALTESGYFNLTASSTSNLVITPTTDFNGTILVSLKILMLETNPYNQNGYNVNSLVTLDNKTNLTYSIIGLSMPDYSNGTNKSVNTTYTASCDGYVLVTTWANFCCTKYLYIDNITITVLENNSSGPYSYYLVSEMYPISKGQTYKTTCDSIVFYPCKGVK